MSSHALSPVAQPAETPWRWTQETYHRAIDLGLFREDEHLELIRGEIYHKMPMKRPHAAALSKTDACLRRCFGEGFYVLTQLPVRLSHDGEPEPDAAVVRGGPDDFAEHPTEADLLLVVEVSDTTLAFDQSTKALLYAEAGIAEYWIVNLSERVVEVRREPREDGYRSLRIYDATESVAPLAAPQNPIAVAQMLPA
jgi:Uma2 family endonuclease